MRLPLIVAVTLSATAAAFGQSMNIDVGTTLSAPSSTFGGAIGQAGAWNNIAPAPAVPLALFDLSGGATAVTVTMTGNGVNYAFNNPGTTGDDELLMDDGYTAQTGAGFLISGLTPGTYNVTVYAMDPQSSTNISSVFIGVPPLFPVGGAWPGSYVSGVTHLTFTGIVTTGSINVKIGVSNWVLNGIQISQVPTPGAAAVLGLGGLAAARRRRR